MSDVQPTIFKQLRDAQLDLHAPKSNTGRFGKSRSAEDVVEAAKPVLAKHGLTLVTDEQIIYVEGRHYIQCTATVYNDAGESIPATGHAWEGELDRGLDTSQVTGKTSSYAKKYALGHLLAIDDTKDADTVPEAPAKASSKPAEPTRSDMMTDIQKKQIIALLRGQGIKDANMVKVVAASYSRDLTNLTKDDAADLIGDIKEYPVTEVQI